MAESVKSGEATRGLSASGNSMLCESVPEVPWRVNVAEPLATFGAAVKVMVCGAPGTRLRLDGDAVTPAGKPARLPATCPLKPLKASAETLICALAPAVNATVGAGPASAKSDWFVLVIAVCVMDPDVAVAVKATGPAVALLPAVITTAWEEPDEPPNAAVIPRNSCWGVSEDRVKVAGAAVTAVGNPESDTFTAPENPFTPAIEMEKVCIEFGVTVTLAGMVTEKSGCETESGVLASTPLPPPQPVKRNGRAMLQTDHKSLEVLAIILDLAEGTGPLNGPRCIKC
jgi:hypothetical protein